MANVFLIGLEKTTADQISRVVSIERHRVRERSYNIGVRDLADGGIVFAGGGPLLYLPLLRRVRKELPSLPFVVVTQTAETRAWLEALDAGATDYCCAPIARRQIQSLMECVIPDRGMPQNVACWSGAPAKSRPRGGQGERHEVVPVD